MSRNIYFSFHYQDVVDFRANVVRNSGKFRKGGGGFRDGSIWEDYPIKKVKEIKGLIDYELQGKSVNCVLIGSETYNRRWVRYEIIKSFAMGKGLVGININWIKDKYGKTKFWPGENPFQYLGLEINKDGKGIKLLEKIDRGVFGKWMPYKDLPNTENKWIEKKYYGSDFTFSDFFKTYSWEWNDGLKHFNEWIEKAATEAGK